VNEHAGVKDHGHEEVNERECEEGNGHVHGEENEHGEGISCVYAEEKVHENDNSRDRMCGTNGRVCVSNHLLGVSKNLWE
jgi:hypothetical protein